MKKTLTTLTPATLTLPKGKIIELASTLADRMKVRYENLLWDWESLENSLQDYLCEEAIEEVKEEVSRLERRFNFDPDPELEPESPEDW